jgi:diacylglycerol kinase family enzyme
MAKAFREGRHGLWEEVRATKGRSFEIRTRRPHPINTDGELVTFTRRGLTSCRRPSRSSRPRTPRKQNLP